MCTPFFGPTTPIICCPFLTVPCCRRLSRRRDSRRSDFSLLEKARDAGLKALRSSRQAGTTRAKSLTPPDSLNAQKLILLVDFCAPQGAPYFCVSVHSKRPYGVNFCRPLFQKPRAFWCWRRRNAELLMLRILGWSLSLRLGDGSGGLVFDHDGGAYQSARWPSWWSASGPPAESCLAVVAEIGRGKGSSVCGGEPGALERERGLRCRLEGGATKSVGPLAEGAQDRCASGLERPGPVGGSFPVVICDVIIKVHVRQSKCLPMDYSNEVSPIDYSNERATIP